MCNDSACCGIDLLGNRMLCWELALGSCGGALLFLAGKGAARRWGHVPGRQFLFPVSCAFLGSGAGADEARDGPPA